MRTRGSDDLDARSGCVVAVERAFLLVVGVGLLAAAGWCGLLAWDADAAGTTALAATGAAALAALGVGLVVIAVGPRRRLPEMAGRLAHEVAGELLTAPFRALFHLFDVWT